MDLPDDVQGPGATVTLDAEQARHARRVLRLSAGSAVTLLDGRGKVAQATLADDDLRTAVCTLVSIDQAPPTVPTIELATAIPKGPRGDAMVSDLAQLGTDRLIPMVTERSVVVPGPTKLQRFAKAVAESAKQSGRAWFMAIDSVTPYADALVCHADLRLVADPDAQPIAGLTQRLDSVSVVRILVGPEGGLTDEELTQAADAGFEPWRYSTNVLRVETAAAAAVAILRAQA